MVKSGAHTHTPVAAAKSGVSSCLVPLPVCREPVALCRSKLLLGHIPEGVAPLPECENRMRCRAQSVTPYPSLTLPYPASLSPLSESARPPGCLASTRPSSPSSAISSPSRSRPTHVQVASHSRPGRVPTHVQVTSLLTSRSHPHSRLGHNSRPRHVPTHVHITSPSTSTSLPRLRVTCLFSSSLPSFVSRFRDECGRISRRVRTRIEPRGRMEEPPKDI